MSKKEEQAKTAAETMEGALSFVRRSFMFWKRSILMFLLVVAAAVPAVFLKARVYKSETTVLYQENIKSTDLTGGEGNGENARRVGARLKEMLFSRASLEPIVKDLPRYAALADRRGMVDAVDELRQHISFQARDGDTFEIGFDGLSPQEAQDVTRRLGERIVQEAAAHRNEQGKATKDYLQAQSDQNAAKLRAADGNLSSFLTVHPEFLPLTLPGGGAKGVLGLPGMGAPVIAPVGTKDPVLFQMEAEAAGIQRQLSRARGEVAPPPPPPPVTESEAVAAARKDLAEKKAQFTDQHPDVVAARRRLANAIEADKRIAPPPPPPQPAGGGAKLSDGEREALEQRLNTLRRNIQARRTGAPPPEPLPTGSSRPPGAGSAVPGSAAVAFEVEFRRLQREVEYLKEAQRQLDDKLFKAGLTEGATSSDRNSQVKILDAAYLPAHPISKPRSTALATFLGVGVVLAIILALVSARLDDRIYQRADLEVLDILPLIGVIPRPSGGSGQRRARNR